MKRFFKTLLVALVLVPALCLVTACGGGNNGGSTGGGGNGGGGNGGGGNGGGGTVVEETLQQKYDAFYTALGKMAQKGSYTASATQNMGETQTITTQHLEEGEWVDDEDQADPQTEGQKNKVVQTVNAETGEMVINYYYWVEEEPAVIGRGVGDEEQADEEEEFVPHWELAVGQGEYIVKTDDEEPAYIYIDGNNAEYVSPDHAAKAYALANSDYVSTLKALIFSSNLEEEVAELGAIPQYLMMFLGAESEIDVACTPTANITKDGDVYSLSIVLNFVATEKVVEEEEENQEELLLSPEDDLEVGAEEEAEPAVLMQGDITLAITYTADDITAFSLVVNINMPEEVREDEDTRTITAAGMAIEMAAEVTYEYSASEMPEDLDLEELEPEAARVYPEFYLDGEYVRGCNVEFNQDATDEVLGRFEEVEDEFELENTHIDGWYYDAACTQKVGETDTFNFKSWETPILYARTVANEGYFLVIEETVIEYPAALAGLFKIMQVITAGELDIPMPSDDGLYIVDGPHFDVYAVEEGSIDYDVYLENESIVKITVNGVEYTEPISEIEDGHTYEVKVYYDMNAMMGGGGTK